jgi:hypothetical protein
MKTIIAIDPGAAGGIAVLYSCGRAVADPMPETEEDVVNYLRSLESAASVDGITLCAFVEKVGGFIKGNRAPGSTMFNFGFGCGVIEGALRAMRIRTVYVRPQEWQKHFSLGTAASSGSKTAWKNKLKAEAQRRFPQLKVTLKTSDALLILDYARVQP